MIANNDTGWFNEDGTLTINKKVVIIQGMSNDTDADGDDISVVGIAGGSVGSAAVTGTYGN